MEFDNECPYYSSSPSSTSSPSQLSPNSQSVVGVQQQQAQSSSHKRKAGRKKFKETRHPVYRGVRQRNGNRWVCEVREPNKKSRIWLGSYPTPEMAARAHDVAVLALKGTSAVFNFPDSASLLPVARSCSALDIREAASKAAYAQDQAFPPTTPSSSSSVNNNNLFVETKRVDDIGVIKSPSSSTEMFFDEEALYNMPGLLDSMAEGLLITPPSMKRAFDWDDVDYETDLTLWTD
ncbi:DNA-binding domain superfamily [Sesbania bispinosa]|nr:DNA-binding domain superfamily [Sesbania bispinosa]